MDNNDLAALSTLDEGVLNDALEHRYKSDRIYTYVGDILVAVNPFKPLSIYSLETASKYVRTQSRPELAPHIFAIADRAYQNLLTTASDQVCVISGESGAGKTESTKYLLRHLVDISSSDFPKKSARHDIEEKILAMNPLLEAFGNAKTLMNDNSSRFGKYIELKLNSSGTVIGASLSHYLLEKCRVVTQGEGESNFHIFGLLLQNLSPEIQSHFKLDPDAEYGYIGHRDQRRKNEEWGAVQDAFRIMGFSADDVRQVYAIISAVLHLGNIVFVPDKGDLCKPSNNAPLDFASELLGVDMHRLLGALVCNEIITRDETIIQPLDISKAHFSLDALAKALYGRLFSWLVSRLDAILTSSINDSYQNIGILDIFGFENFEHNSFEQFCINLANEQLQFFFNMHIFALELAEYQEEGIDGLSVNFTDNKPVLEMFYHQPMGLLALLDEESRFPRGNDRSLVDKFEKHCLHFTTFVKVNGDPSFAIEHYAGRVVYSADGFIDKNKDPLGDHIVRILSSSSVDLIRSLFSQPDAVVQVAKSAFSLLNFLSKKRDSDNAEPFQQLLASRSKRSGRDGSSGRSIKRNKSSGRDRKSSSGRDKEKKSSNREKKDSKRSDAASLGRARQSVSQQFKSSLTLLIAKMNLCNPHFIRCLKPNGSKEPNHYDRPLVHRQLLSTGMLETTRIRREGYSHRFSFREFLDRYRCIAYGYTDKSVRPDRSFCANVLAVAQKQLALRLIMNGRPVSSGQQRDLSWWQLGRSRVFLRYWHVPLLDALVFPHTAAAIIIQSTVRMFLAKRKVAPLLNAFRKQVSLSEVFLSQITVTSMRVVRLLKVLGDEDTRRSLEVLAEPSIPAPVMKKKKESVRVIPSGAKEQEKIRRQIVKWWVKNERSKGQHCDPDGRIYPWFHGMLSREEAEELLASSAAGTYLVRISERFNGYALSFRFEDRLRHYKLVVTPEGGYQISGAEVEFETINDLLEYYHSCPCSMEDNDTIEEPLMLEHDLGLGDEFAQYVDPLALKFAEKRLSDIKTNSVPVKRDKRGNVVQPIRERSNSVVSMVELSDEEMTAGPPLPVSFYLAPGPRPLWLRAPMSRSEADLELERRGARSGSFLVREKAISSKRAVFILSIFFQRFRHCVLEKRVEDEDWALDSTPLGISGLLNDAVDLLSRECHPRLGVKLEVVPLPPAAMPLPTHPATSFLAVGWDSERVAEWLRSINLGKYAETFKVCGVDGNTLRILTDAHIAYFIRNTRDCMTLRNAIESMRSSPSSTIPAVPERIATSYPIMYQDGAVDLDSKFPIFLEQMNFDADNQTSPNNAAPALPGMNVPVSARSENFIVDRGFFKRRRPESKLKDYSGRGDMMKAQQLLRHFPGLNVNSVREGGSGNTPLYVASRAGHVELVKLLLEHGANVSKRNFYGVSPLDIAKKRKRAIVVITLLDHLKKQQQELQEMREKIALMRAFATHQKTMRSDNDSHMPYPSDDRRRSFMGSVPQTPVGVDVQLRHSPKQRSGPGQSPHSDKRSSLVRGDHMYGTGERLMAFDQPMQDPYYQGDASRGMYGRHYSDDAVLRSPSNRGPELPPRPFDPAIYLEPTLEMDRSPSRLNTSRGSGHPHSPLSPFRKSQSDTSPNRPQDSAMLHQVSNGQFSPLSQNVFNFDELDASRNGEPLSPISPVCDPLQEQFVDSANVITPLVRTDSKKLKSFPGKYKPSVYQEAPPSNSLDSLTQRQQHFDSQRRRSQRKSPTNDSAFLSSSLPSFNASNSSNSSHRSETFKPPPRNSFRQNTMQHPPTSDSFNSTPPSPRLQYTPTNRTPPPSTPAPPPPGSPREADSRRSPSLQEGYPSLRKKTSSSSLGSNRQTVFDDPRLQHLQDNEYEYQSRPLSDTEKKKSYAEVQNDETGGPDQSHYVEWNYGVINGIKHRNMEEVPPLYVPSRAPPPYPASPSSNPPDSPSHRSMPPAPPPRPSLSHMEPYDPTAGANRSTPQRSDANSLRGQQSLPIYDDGRNNNNYVSPNTRRPSVDPTMYAQGMDMRSTLPPPIYDDGNNNYVSPNRRPSVDPTMYPNGIDVRSPPAPPRRPSQDAYMMPQDAYNLPRGPDVTSPPPPPRRPSLDPTNAFFGPPSPKSAPTVVSPPPPPRRPSLDPDTFPFDHVVSDTPPPPPRRGSLEPMTFKLHLQTITEAQRNSTSSVNSRPESEVYVTPNVSPAK